MFGYGMDDTDECGFCAVLKSTRWLGHTIETRASTVHWQHDWRAPGRFEDRVEQLFAPFVEQRGRSLDMIVLHSGCASFCYFICRNNRSKCDPVMGSAGCGISRFGAGKTRNTLGLQPRRCLKSECIGG